MARLRQSATGEEYEDAESIEEEIKQRFETIVGSVVPPGQVATEGVQVDIAALRQLQKDEMDASTRIAHARRSTSTRWRRRSERRRRTKFKSENAELLSRVKPLGS